MGKILYSIKAWGFNQYTTLILGSCNIGKKYLFELSDPPLLQIETFLLFLMNPSLESLLELEKKINIFLVVGKWLQWSQWSTCSFDKLSRERECNNNPPHGKRPCIGNKKEEKNCPGINSQNIQISEESQCMTGGPFKLLCF